MAAVRARQGPRRLREALLSRPQPPAHLLAPDADALFLPAPELDAWARAALLDDGAPLFNPEHAHLGQARIAWLWTNAPNRQQMREVVGNAEIPRPPQSGGAWARGRWEQQMREWFPAEDGEPWELPHFLITLFAPFAAEAPDATFCAVVEHELYHCAQALDEFGSPAFHRDTGLPKYGMRGHDAEEFVGVVRRYGAGHAAGGVANLVAAAARRPEIAAAAVAGACGTCGRMAA